MIDSAAVKSAFWIIGFIVILGNAYVVITTIRFLKRQETLNSIGFQRLIILNIALADFMMGIYLLTIASYSVIYSGMYGRVDYEWRSSLRCSIVGSLAVISSETSCFSMVLLTTFRLLNISNPLKAMTTSLCFWKSCLGLTWIIAFVVGIIPLLDITSQYFLHTVALHLQVHFKMDFGLHLSLHNLLAGFLF